MTVGIITWMTCMFAVALTLGGPIRIQAAQSEITVPIGGSVTLLCPLVPDDLWTWVYWKKNDHTIYSHEVKSNTRWTNDTRYAGSNNATRLMIKDLKKTDSGVYYCKVATLVFIKERGHVLLSVTDQEVGVSTTSPGVSLTTSTTIPTIPTQAAEDNAISLEYLIFILIISIIISVIISVIIVCLFFKYRERIMNLQAGLVGAVRRPASTRNSTPLTPGSPPPLTPGSSHCEIRDKEGTYTVLLSSDTQDSDDEDVNDNQNRVQNHPVQGRRYDDPYTNPYRWQPYF